MAEENELLNRLFFGQVDSESEQRLDEKFLRTSDFERFVGPSRIDLVLGPKGSGKSALYQLFDRHEQTVRRWSSAALQDVVINASNGMRDLSALAGDNLTKVLLTPEIDFERLWTSYIGWKAAEAAANGGLGSSGRLRHFQQALNLRRDWRVWTLARRGWHALISDALPGSLKVTVFGTGIELGAGKAKPWDMSEVLRLVDAAAAAQRKTIWLLFDNLDELLSTNRRRRIEALNALFTACNQLRASYPNIHPRIFLRTDIWDDIEFNNKSHWADKQLRLTWTDDQLLRLMIKRAVTDDAVRAHIAALIPTLTSPQSIDDISAPELRAALYLIFQSLIYPKENKGDAWKWMLEHSADGHGQALPRELITFGNIARDHQKESRYPVDGQLISAEAIRRAHADVSRMRCETFLAEFPELRAHFNRFNGRTTARFHRAELERLMDGLQPAGNAMIDTLCEVGVIKPVMGHRDTAREFEVPLLYRPGLKLRLRGRQ
jgi:hypothetical protein